MKLLESRILWGGLLIVGGVLFLLQNMGLLNVGDLFWALLLGLGSLFFLYVFIGNRLHWWALIPGIVLLSIAALVVVGRFAPDMARIWGGAIVLGGIGLSFFAVYLADRQQWWAIIPAGVLVTLGVVATLPEFYPATSITGGVLFVGLGLTFALVALLPGPQGRMSWPWFPAVILLVFGLLIILTMENLLIYLVPLALIAAGVFLIWRSVRRR